MRGQLDLMKASARPWIGIEPSGGIKTSTITFDKAGAHADVAITIKNFDSAPAKNAMAVGFLEILQDEETVVRSELESMCGGVPGVGATLFPGSSVTREWTSNVARDKFHATIPDNPMFVAYIVGCVGYSESSGTAHHTGFAYRYQLPGRNKGMTFSTTLFPNSSLPPGEWMPWFSFLD
jgi:hypothetical protein